MKRVSLQDIFNAAWQKFVLEDNPPAVDPSLPMNCQYLTTDGRKCAVGLCIPDGHEFQNMFSGFGDVVCADRERWEGEHLFDAKIHSMNIEYLNDFQSRLHDDLQMSGQWLQDQDGRRSDYLKVAYDYGLKVPGEQV